MNAAIFEHSPPPLVCFVLTSWNDGGVERVALLLLQEFAERGLNTELVLLKKPKPREHRTTSLLAELPPGTARYISRTRTSSASPLTAQLGFQKINVSPRKLVAESLKQLAKGQIPKHVRDLPALTEHFLRNKPNAVLTMGHRANVAAVKALLESKIDAGIVCSVHSSLNHYAPGELLEAAQYYSKARKVVAVSQGIASQLKDKSKIPHDHIEVIGNPIPHIPTSASRNELPAHEWYREHKFPIVVSVGRISPEKDIATLLKAMKWLQQSEEVRLVIVGGGKLGDIQRLESMAHGLGINEAVYFAGFKTDPLPWICHADLLALSSVSEGFGMVLVEAMSVGTPVVSTNAPPGGPAEILQEGDFGRLVEPGNPKALAIAIKETLKNPPDRNDLLARAKDYSLGNVADTYLACMGLSDHKHSSLPAD